MLIEFKSRTTKAAKTAAKRIADGLLDSAEAFARINATCIASETGYTEDEAYEAIMWKANSLARLYA